MNSTMRTILVPYDGSTHAKHALEYAIELAGRGGEELHILNVQTPLSGDVSGFVGSSNVKQYHHDEGEKVLVTAKRQLEKADVPYHSHIGVGQAGPVICDFADQLKCSQVVMGTRGDGGALGALLGSAANHVIGHVKVPVTLVK